jgi:nucleotide-binding universal stress UspA family protein
VSGFLKRILVPVDGSPPANRAVEVACVLARTVGAELVFCDAVNHAAAIAEMTVPSGIIDSAPILDALDGGASAIAGAAEQAAKADGLTASSAVIDGAAGNAIINYAKAHEIDAIVMGTRGTGGLERLVLGSTADEVLRGSELPTIVVQALEDAAAPAFKRLLVASDDSAPSASALAFALELAAGQGGSLVLCHALASGAPAEQRASAQALLDAGVAQARSRSIEAETCIFDGDPAEQIIAAAQTHHADAIALGTHGRSGFARLFEGSVAEAVVRRSPLPVIVLR